MLTTTLNQSASSGGGVGPVNFDFSGGSVPGGVAGSGAANGTAFNSSNLIAAATAPRIDYGNMFDPNNPTRANYILQSNSFLTAPWTLQHVTAATPVLTQPGGSTLPDGVQAWQGVFAAVVATNQDSKIQQFFNLPAGIACVASVWVKGTVGGEVLTLTAQAPASPFTILGSMIITATTSWVQYSISFVAPVGQALVSFGTDSTTGNQTTQAGGTVLFGEFQVEAGAIPTAYIATTTTAVQGASNPSGVLIEPARTNFVLQSNTLADAAWSTSITAGKSVVVTANTGTGPDGVANSATQLVISATTTGTAANRQQLVTGLTAGVTHQAEVWVKGNAGGETLYLGAQMGLTPFTSLGFTRISANGAAWQRYTLAFVPPGTSVFLSVGSNAQGTGQLAASGGTIFVWNVQVEAGDFPTSDIITTSAAVTRTADAVSFTTAQDRVNLTFPDGSVQKVGATAGTYTLPAALNRKRVKSLVSSASATSAITGLTYGSTFAINSLGVLKFIRADTWNATWCSDDFSYTPCDDVNQFPSAGTTANMAVVRLTNWTPNVQPTMTNVMASWGTATQLGADGASYKAAGLISVNGVLGLFATRQLYGTSGNGHLQTTLSGQLVTSTDKGVTWAPVPPSTAEPYASPMFTNVNFSTPFFIQYGGRDYQNNYAHRSDTYVYAMTTDGWNNRTNMYLMRCLISAFPNKNASDWQAYLGGDGMLDANWGALGSGVPIMTNTSKIGMNGAQFLDACERYVCVQWYYQSLAPGTTNTTSNTAWDLYEAQFPWGPWTKVQSAAWSPQGFYNPNVMPQSLSVDGGATLSVITAGDYLNQSVPATTPYTLNIIPATVTH